MRWRKVGGGISTGRWSRCCACDSQARLRAFLLRQNSIQRESKGTITSRDSTRTQYKDWGEGPVVTFSRGCKTLDNFDFTFNPKMNRRMVFDLATCV